MSLIYATLDDVKGQAPTGLFDEVEDATLTRLLRLASAAVGKATRAAIYDTDPNGMPSDLDKREAMRDATCCQIMAWVEAGVHGDILTSGATSKATVASSSINGASVSFDDTQGQAARSHLLGGGMGTEAALILEDAGLLGGLPSIWY